MAVCKVCRRKYNWWTAPVSAKGVCAECFAGQLRGEIAAEPQEHPRAVENVSAKPISPITAIERRVAPIRLVSFVPRTRSKTVFALVMGCYSVTLVSLMSAWAYVAHVRSPPRAFYLLGGGKDVIGLLVFAPLFESFVLVGVFELVRRVHAPAVAQVLVSALFISALHVAPWWPHAVIVVPSFCIQAASYLYWRDRGPWKDAFWVLASIHALHNFIPALNTLGYAIRHA